ncbi:MAG: zinc ABC transporter substrate-binding protein [Gammaproteobacteria bacterium]|nr:zinc ABC transporter substrate-binding protein [Gammaproteobacteria bacterium]
MLLIKGKIFSYILGACWVLSITPASADVPQVATDIPPVHSLVSQVMGDLGTPKLIVPPGTSPHGYAMRPSEARALQDADVTFWMGPDLTPWLGRAIKSLTGNAINVALSNSEDLVRHPFRTGATFDSHDHHDHGDEHKEAHKDDHGDHGDEHEGLATHRWLDPDNARILLGVISSTLAGLDPTHADTYRANAAQAKKAIAALTHELDAALQPIRGRPFIVFHDAYQYFEHRFNVDASGSVALGDASSPGPARIAAIRQKVQTLGAHCVFSEPQFRSKIITTVIEGTTARSATLDPLGATLKPGPELYSQLLRNLGDNLLTCLR